MVWCGSYLTTKLNGCELEYFGRPKSTVLRGWKRLRTGEY